MLSAALPLLRGHPPQPAAAADTRPGCNAGETLLHVVELALTDRNVPANDTVGGGLVFANPVSPRVLHLLQHC